MDDDQLAIHGGSKTIKRNFKSYNSIGQEEIEAGGKLV